MNIPKLLIGEPGKNTTSNAATSDYYYSGDMAHWDDFRPEVKQWYKLDPTKSAFERCKDKIVVPAPETKDLNKYSFVNELANIGAESSMSARFDLHVLLPVLSISSTMKYSDLEEKDRPEPRLLDRSFGDHYTLDKKARPENAIADVLLLRKIEEDDGSITSQTRLVGELKNFVTTLLNQEYKSTLDDPNFYRMRCLLGWWCSSRSAYSQLTKSFRPGHKVHACASYEVCVLLYL